MLSLQQDGKVQFCAFISELTKQILQIVNVVIGVGYRWISKGSS